jgi:hypothetical protein
VIAEKLGQKLDVDNLVIHDEHDRTPGQIARGPAPAPLAIDTLALGSLRCPPSSGTAAGFMLARSHPSTVE